MHLVEEVVQNLWVPNDALLPILINALLESHFGFLHASLDVVDKSRVKWRVAAMLLIHREVWNVHYLLLKQLSSCFLLSLEHGRDSVDSLVGDPFPAKASALGTSMILRQRSNIPCLRDP